jgi:predicted TPR repeat methyltransferase
VPELVSNSLLASMNKACGPVDILDIGCGTGLCGVLLKTTAKTLVGVDLSSKMLEKPGNKRFMMN